MEIVTISLAEYEDLKAQIQRLLEQLRVIKSKQFGSSSEKTSEEMIGQLNLLFNEPEVYAEENAKPEAPAVEVKAHSRQRKSGSARDILSENTEVVEIRHTRTEKERVCPQCGEVMQPIGTEVQEKIEIIPARIILRRDIYETYACENCKKNDFAVPVLKKPKGLALIPGSFASAEAVAHYAVQKFVMGSPLYRQEPEWNRQEFMISQQTISNQMICCADDWMRPVYYELHRQLSERDLLHADETELQVLHENGKEAKDKSYMWLYRTSGDAEHPIVLYEYQPGRGQEYPAAFLKGFHGYLQNRRVRRVQRGRGCDPRRMLGTHQKEVRRGAPGCAEGNAAHHSRAERGQLQLAAQAGGKVQRASAGRTEKTAAGTGKACFRRNVGVGKHPECRAEVQTGDCPELFEEPMDRSDHLFAGRSY